ncbi:MAG: MoaD/ThiS family protein [Chloroflexi bacterium]|nr:MoaD/ThiS family protein [Chloroflexota bacterium]
MFRLLRNQVLAPRGSIARGVVLGVARSMVRVNIEVLPWLSRAFGGDGAQRLVFEWETKGPQTLQTLFRDLIDHFPEAARIWAASPSEYLCLVWNGSLVEAVEWESTLLQEGDRVTLVPAYAGG